MCNTFQKILADKSEKLDGKESVMDDCHNCKLRHTCKDAKHNDKCIKWTKEDEKTSEAHSFTCYECGESLKNAKNIRRCYVHAACSKVLKPYFEYEPTKIIVEKNDLVTMSIEELKKKYLEKRKS